MLARARGRPKGSKDKPRQPGAPVRGRPKKVTTDIDGDADNENSDTEVGIQHGNRFNPPGLDFDATFDAFDALTAADWESLDQAALDGLGDTNSPPPISTSTGPSFQQLEEARKRSQAVPFFTRESVFNQITSDTESDVDLESQCEDDNPTTTNKDSRQAWFKKPKFMPAWLYEYFRDTIQPLITQKDGRKRAEPPSFTSNLPHAPQSFWIHPPEPAFMLAHYRFRPAVSYRPRVFLWLPHFLVNKLCCPDCGKALEKNGALSPRRITDVADSFYIVAWAYYCRAGCKSHFHGWSRKILDSLPPYLRHAFPAVLSRKAGLSHTVLTILRVGNQHKMGPSGVHSLLCENHTLRFSTLQLQYLEAIFEMVRGRPTVQSTGVQSTLHEFLPDEVPSFGNFGDAAGYGGFVPSERYLAAMLNRAIEADEADANQHTSCLETDQLAIDDSHKVNKHIAKIDGVPTFTALWTCMTSRYIRAQVLTLTKSHEERYGPLRAVAQSVKTYGFTDPVVVYSDDPVKDKPLMLAAFPSLAKDLTPMAAAYGLKSLELPNDCSVQFLATPTLVESALSSVMAQLDAAPNGHLCVSLDAEWNLSRRIGVSVLQLTAHTDPTCIFVIPVHKFDRLPSSLLRLLVSNRVFKIGSSIKGDQPSASVLHVWMSH